MQKDIFITHRQYLHNLKPVQAAVRQPVRYPLSSTLKKRISSDDALTAQTRLKRLPADNIHCNGLEKNAAGLREHAFLHGNNRGGAAFIVLALIFIVAAAVFLYQYQLHSPRNPSPTSESNPAALSDTPADIMPEAIKIEVRTLSVDSASVEISAAVREAATAGDYARAAGLLRVAMQQYPDSSEVKSMLATVLNNDALKEMDSGRYKEADELLAEADAISTDITISRNHAQAQIKLVDYKGAVQTLEQLGNDPSAKGTLESLYSQIAEKAQRDGRLDESVEYYEKLAVLRPGDVQLRRFIAGLKKEAVAEGQMGATDGSHFTVKYDGGENAVAGHVIGFILEEAYHKIGVDMEFYPEDRIEALLYSRETFRDVTGSPSWAGALYDGRIKVPAGGVTDKTALLEKVLFHEYTHAVVHRLSGGRAPVWLNEGLAQLEEDKSDGRYKNDLKASAIAFKETRATHNILRVLEGSFMNMNTNQAQAAYLISLSATQYLIKEFGSFSARRILENLREGKNMDDAVNDALHMSYDDFFDAWLTSLSHS